MNDQRQRSSEFVADGGDEFNPEHIGLVPAVGFLFFLLGPGSG